MEQQKNKVNNPDNASVENQIEPLDRIRDAVRSSLRQLQMVKKQRRVTCDSLTVPSGPETAEQQIAVNESVSVMNTPNAPLEGEDSTNTMTICHFPNEVMYKILKYLSFDAIAVNRVVSSAQLFLLTCSNSLFLHLGMPSFQCCLQRHFE